MRFTEFRINEASNLSTAELVKYAGAKGDRIPTFLNKIKNNQPFQLVGGGSVTIDPEEYAKAQQFLVPGASGSLALKTTDGGTVITSKLAKTADLGGQAGSAEGSNSFKFNRGEVAEGYHALSAFVRLIARPSSPITLDDVRAYIPKLKNNQTLIIKAADAENKELADEFHVTISLKPGTWEAFQDPRVLQDREFKKYVQDIINDANRETGRRADLYATNGKYDLVRVVGDGVSGETETKTDINFENETEKKYRGYSIKAGTTSQIHQVGGGAVKDSNKGKAASPEERYRILQDELFGVHGLARIADISKAQGAIIAAFQQNTPEGRLEGQDIAYRTAVESMNANLQGDDEENTFLKTLVKALKYFQTRGDESILLKQFSGKGTYILDAKQLDNLHERGLDLVAEYVGSKSNPELVIKDTKSNKILITIRTYKNAAGYVRNYIEKGPLFVEITNIATEKQPADKKPAPTESAPADPNATL